MWVAGVAGKVVITVRKIVASCSPIRSGLILEISLAIPVILRVGCVAKRVSLKIQPFLPDICREAKALK
jgi:hypothetical protein